MDRESFGARKSPQEAVEISDVNAEIERARKADAREARAAAESYGLRHEGPQIYTHEQFGKESSKWLKKLTTAQDALMKEIINRAVYKGENVSALDAQAAVLKSWIDRVWALSIQNAHEGLTDPNGMMTIDHELLDAVDGDVMKSVEGSLEHAAFPEQIKARAGFKEVADLRENFDVLQDRLDALQKAIAEEDARIRKLMKEGEFDAKTAKMLAEEREELERLHRRDMKTIKDIIPKLNRALDAYESAS